MRILAYRGKSLLSLAIRLQTRSKYSHIAVELNTGHVVEAWRKGVTLSKDFSEVHSPGTKVDVFIVDHPAFTHEVTKHASGWLISKVGRKYDFMAILRFLSRRKEPADNKWFCSELAHAALLQAGITLLDRIPSSYVSPRDLVLSPYLTLEKTKVTS